MSLPESRHLVRDDDEATASVGAVLSLLITLAFLGLVSQTLLHLFASTVVSATAYDAARQVAAEGNTCDGVGGPAPVPAVVSRRLGAMAGDASLTVSCRRGTEQAQVVISVDSPGPRVGFLPMFDGVRVEQQALVRVERWR